MRERKLMPVLVLVALSAAVAGYSASTAVGNDGKKWSAEVSQLNATCWNSKSSPGIKDVEYRSSGGQKTVEFTGAIKTGTPCQVVTHRVKKVNGRHVMNIKTEAKDGVCVQCVGMVRYEARFKTDDAFRLEVRHNGEKVDTLEHTGKGSGEDDKDGGTPGSVIKKLLDWLSRLF